MKNFKNILIFSSFFVLAFNFANAQNVGDSKMYGARITQNSNGSLMALTRINGVNTYIKINNSATVQALIDKGAGFVPSGISSLAKGDDVIIYGKIINKGTALLSINADTIIKPSSFFDVFVQGQEILSSSNIPGGSSDTIKPNSFFDIPYRIDSAPGGDIGSKSGAMTVSSKTNTTLNTTSGTKTGTVENKTMGYNCVGGYQCFNHLVEIEGYGAGGNVGSKSGAMTVSSKTNTTLNTTSGTKTGSVDNKTLQYDGCCCGQGCFNFIVEIESVGDRFKDSGMMNNSQTKFLNEIQTIVDKYEKLDETDSNIASYKKEKSALISKYKKENSSNQQISSFFDIFTDSSMSMVKNKDLVKEYISSLKKTQTITPTAKPAPVVSSTPTPQYRVPDSFFDVFSTPTPSSTQTIQYMVPDSFFDVFSATSTDLIINSGASIIDSKCPYYRCPWMYINL